MAAQVVRVPIPMPVPAPAPRLLAYLVYGDNVEYQAEAAFSIATARLHLGEAPADVEIVVITDQAQFAYPLEARRIDVSQSELSRWTKHGSCNHRAKVCALQRLLREDVSAVALVDTDTYFTGDPSALVNRISPTQSVMHEEEGALGDDDVWRPLFADPACALALRAGGCSADTIMFNSGVIGVHSEQRAAVDEALAWLDAQVATTPAFSLEQVAISRALQLRSRVVTSDDLLVHYWGYQRPFVHVQIKRALATRSIRIEDLGMPRPGLRERLRASMVGAMFHWDPDCRFSYHAMLAALASRKRADGYSEAWAETAVEALARAQKTRGPGVLSTPGLRRSLRPLGRAAWLAPELKERWQRLWDAAGPLSSRTSLHEPRDR